MFSVRTAYHMIMENGRERSGPSQSNSKVLEGIWKKVWKVSSAPKVRSFLWRVCKEILPCEANLHRCKITPDGWCGECGKLETGMHALVHCRISKRVWKQCPGLARYGKHSDCFLDVFGQLVEMEKARRGDHVGSDIMGNLESKE